MPCNKRKSEEYSSISSIRTKEYLAAQEEKNRRFRQMLDKIQHKYIRTGKL